MLDSITWHNIGDENMAKVLVLEFKAKQYKMLKRKKIKKRQKINWIECVCGVQFLEIAS